MLSYVTFRRPVNAALIHQNPALGVGATLCLFAVLMKILIILEERPIYLSNRGTVNIRPSEFFIAVFSTRFILEGNSQGIPMRLASKMKEK